MTKTFFLHHIKPVIFGFLAIFLTIALLLFKKHASSDTKTPVFYFAINLPGNSFFIDPENGDINNNGSFDMPWNTLQEVIEKKYIETYKNTLPYDASTNKLIIKNENAQVKAGDTLYLLSGLHGEIQLTNFNNLKKITVIAFKSHKPIVKKLKLVIPFLRVRIERGLGAGNYFHLIFFLTIFRSGF